ncbi:Rieske 2Fe-2S domain-containing protein [Trinickia fusca]|uniref:Salicylate hydroxylase n=1 Tax=Trinickia fusca TaxID=2419777 RepID=A0A494X7H7_9BURK|nr:Rieske 2Fe-2S domain-containing protein [Trinickia fusca]RKP44144.1 salicylate hydroxylase [Trinickia fusca]
MSSTHSNLLPDGVTRTPFSIYTDEELYRRELERFFYAKHWCYIGLEAEIPNPGDFRLTEIGERQVIMTRTEDGSVSVVENVCSHRGMRFCRKNTGNATEFRCPYHQWSYSLKGDLQGVPFLRGMKQDGRVNGGMPADFRREDHGLVKLKVATRGGVVFASFDHDVEPLEDFLGPEILKYFDRLFHGPKLTLLGYQRQRIPGNWKLIQENIKDPYHGGLLHTWFVNFGLWRADNKSELIMDKHHRHGAMVGKRSEGGKGQATVGITSFKNQMELNDNRLLDVQDEPWWGEPTVVMLTLMPSVIIQQNVNSLVTRRIRPVSPGVFDYVWTYFGLESDDAAMTERRLRQANLMGPAGYVSADDGEVVECVQESFASNPYGKTLTELGGREIDLHTDHIVSETLMRGMYDYWRRVMEA